MPRKWILNSCLLALPFAPLATGARAAKRRHRPPAQPRKHDRGWWDRVSRAVASQPHWITPLATVTPLLAEEFRFDEIREVTPSRSAVADSFDGKGLELIPTQHIELLAGIPPYLHRDAPSPSSGWGDFPVLAKYRLFAAPAGRGNYVITAFFGASFPTATKGNGAGKVVLRPAVAFGKGWGDFDVQATFGAALPAGAWRSLGTPLALNAAFQYRFLEKLWPEVEVNSTAWPNGTNAGRKETFLTPGLVAGRFPFWGRTGLVFGAGMQIATTHFHRTNHNLILTLRLPF